MSEHLVQRFLEINNKVVLKIDKKMCEGGNVGKSRPTWCIHAGDER